MGSRTSREPTLAVLLPGAMVTESSSLRNVMVPASGSTSIRVVRPTKYGSSGTTTVPASMSAGCEDATARPSTTIATGAPWITGRRLGRCA